MPQGIATIIFALVILGLFLLDRDRNSRFSPTLWIPIVWLSISASRTVSQWVGGVAPLASPDALEEGSPFDALIFAGLLAAGLVVLHARGERAGTLLRARSEEHTSELQSPCNLVCRLLLEKKKRGSVRDVAHARRHAV